MLELTRTISLVLLSVLATGAQQPHTGAIAGTVTDTSGGVLPGVTLTLTGPRSDKTVSNARGEYRFENVPIGEYRIEAILPGFRRSVATVTLTEGATTKTDIVLRLGLLSIVDYVMPKDGVQGAVREADVVAQIRVTGTAPTRLASGESRIVTDHDAVVVSVVKADTPNLVPGSPLRFGQDNAGEWFEEGYRARGMEVPYRPGDSILAFLMRNKDATLSEFRGQWYMWPVKQGFVVIDAPNLSSFGLRSPMPVDEALSALRKLLIPKNPEPR
jgi:hypothetical protein